jgi:hypothetical protein
MNTKRIFIMVIWFTNAQRNTASILRYKMEALRFPEALPNLQTAGLFEEIV